MFSSDTAAEVNTNLDTLFGDHTTYEKVFTKLKQAVAADDKATVASMVDYPFQARMELAFADRVARSGSGGKADTADPVADVCF